MHSVEFNEKIEDFEKKSSSYLKRGDLPAA